MTHDLEKIAEEIENEKRLNYIIDSFDKEELKSPLSSLFFTSDYFSSEGYDYDLDDSEKNKNYTIRSMFEFRFKGKKLSSKYAHFCSFLPCPIPNLPDSFKSYAAEPYIFIDNKKNKRERHYIIQRINDIFYIDTRHQSFTNEYQPIFFRDDVSSAKISVTLKDIIKITQATINACYNAERRLFMPRPYSIDIFPVGHSIETMEKRRVKLKLIKNKEEILRKASDTSRPKLKLIKQGDEQ